MAEGSIIAWTHNTFNPWMGCTKVSAGCKHCYAETLTKNRMGLNLWGDNATRQVTSASYWKQPFAWAKAAKLAGERRYRMAHRRRRERIWTSAHGSQVGNQP
jgi:protein gp37